MQAQPAVATEWQPIDRLHPSQQIWMPAYSISAEFYVGIDPDAGGVSRM
jgi:hypothetical protein